MTVEKKAFQAEVSKLLHLVTHSLYSNKEIFLRELISNASDALEKLRFEALSDKTLDDKNLKIWVDVDKDAKTITVTDNGIGMSRQELIDNLGTIAKSGTDEFLKALEASKGKESKMIGQFGVGFYSSFIVAEKVVVNSRRAGSPADKATRWVCEGQGEYTVEDMTQEGVGTEIILYLKDSELEFLEGFRLRNIIKKYSDHILFPVIMKAEPLPKMGEDDKEDKKEEGKEPEDEVVNQASALWTLPRSQIKDEEYKTFYKHIAHDFQVPMLWSHNKVEGKLEYTTLLYIPSRAPFGLWNREQKHGLKLYVHRVFIMDEAEQLLPLYLRFVKGVVDSNDLPLNVSRELLQSNHVVESIRSSCTRRVLEMLEKLAKEDVNQYQKFWNEFGQALKEGVGEDFANKDRLAKLFRFASTHEDTTEQKISLADYVSRMQKDQDKIYYIIGENQNAVRNSPHLEIFRKKNIEVLLLTDRIDEWLVSQLTEYEGKALQSVTKGELGDLDNEKDEEAKKEEQAGFDSLLEQAKKILKEKAEEVRLTNRLTDSPACLVSNQDGMSLHLQRLLKEAGQEMPAIKPILEINPGHPIIKELKEEQDDQRFEEWMHILFDQALLAEGGKLEDPATFVKRLNKFLLETVK